MNMIKPTILCAAFCLICSFYVYAQTPCSSKVIIGDWQLYKIEVSDTAKTIKEPTNIYLRFKSLGRVRGPIWNSEAYGHYWGKYKVRDGSLAFRLKYYFPDFLGKNILDVEYYLRYLNSTVVCEANDGNLVLTFQNTKSKYGARSGKLYFRPKI